MQLFKYAYIIYYVLYFNLVYSDSLLPENTHKTRHTGRGLHNKVCTLISIVVILNIHIKGGLSAPNI